MLPDKTKDRPKTQTDSDPLLAPSGKDPDGDPGSLLSACGELV